MLMIVGSQGEGGGQVLRTSLSLSALTSRPFRIEKIRANRSRPGLRPQHLTAVHATAAICHAELAGDELDSDWLEFSPGSTPSGGEYHFDVAEASPSGHSAGAVTLVMQAILWPLQFASGPATVTIQGGTFVPFSPPYHYLSEVARPVFTALGADFELELARWGWMAAGGGRMIARVKPVRSLRAVRLRPQVDAGVCGLAAVTNLPSHIPHRMARRAHNLLTEAERTPAIDALRERGDGPGAGIMIWCQQAGSSSLGRKGLPAEDVAQAAVAEILSFMDNGVAVDRYLADQLLVPMALAHGQSNFTTDHISRHLLTNAQLLRQWLGVSISVQGSLGEPGRIMVNGVGYRPGHGA